MYHICNTICIIYVHNIHIYTPQDGIIIYPLKKRHSPKDSHEHKTRKSVLNSITLNFIVTTLIFQEGKLEAEL